MHKVHGIFRGLEARAGPLASLLYMANFRVLLVDALAFLPKPSITIDKMGQREAVVGGLWRARAEMVKLVRLYDAGKSSASLFGVLLASGCADIALALASRPGSQQLNPQQEAAMKAAAGQWKPAVAAALQAHQQLLSYPK